MLLALFALLAPWPETPARVFEVRTRDIIAIWDWDQDQVRRASR